MFRTYRTIATLLAQVALPVACKRQFGLLHLSDARIHTLWHIIIGGTLRLGDKEKLKFKLRHLVWSSSLNNGISALALDAGCVVGFFSSPFIEASDVDNIRTAVAARLVILETDV